jgi:hypothetical protein
MIIPFQWIRQRLKSAGVSLNKVKTQHVFRNDLRAMINYYPEKLTALTVFGLGEVHSSGMTTRHSIIGSRRFKTTMLSRNIGNQLSSDSLKTHRGLRKTFRLAEKYHI